MRTLPVRHEHASVAVPCVKGKYASNGRLQHLGGLGRNPIDEYVSSP